MTDYYTIKIPEELRDLFRKYIEKHKELGFKTVSQYILHLLRTEAKRLIDGID